MLPREKLLVTLLSLSLVLSSNSTVCAQAGRYIPLPRIPTPPMPRLPVGGGSHIHPHIHVPVHANGERRAKDDTAGWIVLSILGSLALVSGGWFVGRAIGGKLRPRSRQ